MARFSLLSVLVNELHIKKVTADKVLIVTLSNIGDLVMTTPVFEAIADSFAGVTIDVVADPRSSQLISHAPYIDQVFHRYKRRGYRSQLSLLKEIRRTKYLYAVDLRTFYIGALAKAGRHLSKSSWHRRNKNTVHAVQEHFSVVARTLKRSEIPECKVYISETAKERANDVLGHFMTRKFLAVAPGANWPGKRWPASRYEDVIRKVAHKFEGIVALGTEDDLDNDTFNLSASGLEGIDLRGKTDLQEAAAVLSKAQLFLGNDSGLGHVAAGVGVKTLTIFGPGEPKRYRPWGDRGRVIVAPHRSLAKLDSEAVKDALYSLLDD